MFVIKLGISVATRGKSFRAILLASLLSVWLALPFSAKAAESLTLIQPPGGTDLDQAILPPPGLYGFAVLIPYNRNEHYYDSKGHKVSSENNVVLSVPIIATGLLYTYPIEVFGGRLASSISISAYDMDYDLPGNTKGRTKGFADAYADVFYWTKNVGLMGVTPGALPLSYGLNVGAGLGLRIPMGKYSEDQPVNPGSNIWIPIPNVAITYVTGPNMSLGDATEISARIFYGFPQENPDTHYKSGQIVNVDFSVAQRFGLLRVGVAGAYQEQTTGDEPPTGGFDRGKTSFSNIGPIAEYTFPKAGVQVKAKFTFSMSPENTTDANVFMVSVAKRF